MKLKTTCALLIAIYLFASVPSWVDGSNSDSFNLPNKTVGLEFEYHNHAALTDYLNAITEKYPKLTHLYSIGKSVQGFIREY